MGVQHIISMQAEMKAITEVLSLKEAEITALTTELSGNYKILHLQSNQLYLQSSQL